MLKKPRISLSLHQFCVKLFKSAGKNKTNQEHLNIFLVSASLFVFRLPFLKERTSDELTFRQDVTQFLSHTGILQHRCQFGLFVVLSDDEEVCSPSDEGAAR